MKAHQTVRFFGKFVLFGVAFLLVVTEAHAGILFQDGFESGDRSHTENGIQWTSDAWGEQPGDFVGVSNENPKTGAYSLKMQFGASGNGDAWAEQNFSMPPMDEFWIAYDVWIPPNYFHRATGGSTAGNNNKSIVTVWKGNNYSGTGWNFEMYPASGNPNGTSRLTFRSVCPETGHIGYVPNFIALADRGKWVNWKIQVVPLANGAVRVWKNGNLFYENTNISFNSSCRGINRGYILGWSNSGFDENTTLYVDNVVIADSEIDVVRPAPPGNLQVQ